MKTDAERAEERAEAIAEAIVMTIFGIIVLAVAAALLAMFFDMGQLNGYCKAEGGKVEDTVCIKDDRVVKRGKDV